jgi:deoxyinosine 3'endonuclease (endonuclease V)
MGLASHLGVLIDVPTIGIGKNFLTIDGLEIDGVKDKTKIDCPKKGQCLKLIGESGTCWGASLATNDDSRKPIYISIGHRISLETAVELVKLCSKYKIPEPIRVADLGSREYLRNLK